MGKPVLSYLYVLKVTVNAGVYLVQSAVRTLLCALILVYARFVVFRANGSCFLYSITYNRPLLAAKVSNDLGVCDVNACVLVRVFGIVALA